MYYTIYIVLELYSIMDVVNSYYIYLCMNLRHTFDVTIREFPTNAGRPRSRDTIKSASI